MANVVDEESTLLITWKKVVDPTEKFMILVIEDLGLVKINDIVAILPQPKVHRMGKCTLLIVRAYTKIFYYISIQ